MNKKKILVLGSIAYDYIMDFKKNFLDVVNFNKKKRQYQSTVIVNSWICQFGGTAGNISYHLGKLGAHCTICCAVGKDFISMGYKEHLDKFDNINQIIEIYDDLNTAACFIVNDSSKNQMIIFNRGASNKNIELSLQSKIKDVNEYFMAINTVQSVSAMIHFTNELEKLNIPFIFDPGQAVPLFPPKNLKKIIKKSTILICNENEFNTIKKKTQQNKEELFDIVPIILITKGEKGSVLYSKDQNILVKIPCCKVEKVIDPTGAGDAFRGGFLTGLIKGMSLEDASKLGSIISSFVVKSKGAQSIDYTIDEIKQQFKVTYGNIPKELK